jgi:hypothetical protein
MKKLTENQYFAIEGIRVLLGCIYMFGAYVNQSWTWGLI